MYHLRKMKAFSPIPIVAVTADAMIGAEEKYIAAGFDAYISKPFQKNDILQIIHRFQGKEK